MSPKRPESDAERPDAGLLGERHQFPSCSRDFLDRRFGWDCLLLGQRCAFALKMCVFVLHINDPFDDTHIGRYCIFFSAFDSAPGPISCTAFNRTGNIFAYAVTYDWSRGHSGMTPNHPNKIMLHACKEDEVKKRAARK